VSHAFDLVQAALHGSARVGGHSWLVVNRATSSALTIAIEYRFDFEVDDMRQIFRVCRIHGDIDWYYSLACKYGNKSAALSLEKYREHKPFFVRLRSFGPSHKTFPGAKALNRAHVGCHFTWKEEQVKVTSFSGDRQNLIACAYQPKEHHSDPDKIKRRFVISRAEMRIAEVVEKRTSHEA